MQKQQQNQEEEQERQQQCQTRTTASAASKTGPGSGGETEVSTDGEAGSSSSCSSSDSDEADADDAIDFLFAELMAEEAALPGGAAATGEGDGSNKGADQELLLYLSGVSSGQASATNVIEMGAVRAI